MSNSMSLPSNFEMSNMTGDAVKEQDNIFQPASSVNPHLIEENVDGEESKESLISH